MYTKTIGLLFLIAAMTKGQAQNVTSLSSEYPDSFAVRDEFISDDFISVYIWQLASILQDCDTRLENEKKSYNERINTINTQRAALKNSLTQTFNHLNLLQAFGGSPKACAKKYRPSIPTIKQTELRVDSCINEARSQGNTVWNSPLNTRNNFENNLDKFKEAVAGCGKNFGNSTANYTICVLDVASKTTTSTINNQKTLNSQMYVADCSAGALITNALGCFFEINYSTITSVAETKTSINECILRPDNCGNCSQGYTCPNVHYLDHSEVDFENITMPNPFYGRDNRTDCLMLDMRH